MPVIFLCVIIFCAWLHYQIKKSNTNASQTSENFWYKERKSNSVRKVDISKLDYIKIPLGELPFQETTDDSLIQIQNKVKDLTDSPILNLTGISNTDLKLQYGAGNLAYLADCDQNFILLARALNEWASYLYKQNDMENAKKILEYSVSCHSDIKNVYILLSSIYRTEGSEYKIAELLKKAESLTTLNKDVIIAHLKS